MPIRLTVVIPNYNCKKYLGKCLDSVLPQLPLNGEVIVVDDGSTDDSLEWLREKQAVAPQMRIMEQCNEGIVSARNNAIKAARGEIIAFLDADDYWYPNKVTAQMDYMLRNPGCVLSFTNYDHVSAAYDYIVNCFDYWEEVTLPSTSASSFKGLPDAVNTLLSTNIVGTSTVFARKEALIRAGLFDSSLTSASDWDMWLKLASIGPIAYNSTSQVGYLVRSGSHSSNRLSRLHAMTRIIDFTVSTGEPAKTAIRIARAKVKEGYAEYYREQKRFALAAWNDIQSLAGAPYLRTIKHLCLDMARAITS